MATKMKLMTPARLAKIHNVPPPPEPPTIEEIVDAVWATVGREYDEQPPGTITVNDIMAAKNVLSDRAQNMVAAAVKEGTLERAGWMRFVGPSGTIKRKPLYRPKVKVD